MRNPNRRWVSIESRVRLGKIADSKAATLSGVSDTSRHSDRHRSGPDPGGQFTAVPIPIAAEVLATLIRSPAERLLDLGLECLLQHAPGTISGQLIEGADDGPGDV